MEKLSYVSSYFEPSETVTHQGTRSSIQKFLNQGFSVQQERNGFWVLIKKSHAWVIFKDRAGNQHKFDMRNKIMTHYGKQKLYEATFNRFVKEVSNGTINIYLDSANNCVIM